MLTKLFKLIRINLDDLGLCAGVVGGAFLVLQIVMAAVVGLAHENSALLLSGIVLPIVAGGMILLVAFSHTMFQFEWAVRYSRSRRQALGLTLGLIGAESVFSMALAALLAWAERLLAPTLWLKLSGLKLLCLDGIAPIPEGGLSADAAAIRAATFFVEDFSVMWWLYPLIALGCVAVGIIGGAVLLRFGGKGGWVLWTVFMGVTLGPQLLPAGMLEAYTVIDLLLPVAVAAVAAVVAGFIWSLWSLLHASVKA